MAVRSQGSKWNSAVPPVDNSRISQIEEAINEIYLQNSSKLSFQSLYTLGYHLVLQKQGEQLYTAVEGVIKAQIKRDCETVKGFSNDTFLHSLLEVWDLHGIALKMIHDILMYMDKHYVGEHRKLSITALGIKLFGDHLLREQNVMQRFRELTLNLIYLERNKEVVPSWVLLKSLTSMMIAVDRKDVYEPLLETPYLAASMEYYQRDAEKAIETLSVPDYLSHVFDRLREERERAERSLDTSTLAKIDDIVKQCMIVHYREVLLTKEDSGCTAMLKQWRLDDIRRLYKCMIMINDTSKMIDLVKETLLHSGKAILNSNEGPIKIIEELIHLQEKYNQLLHTSFVSDDDEQKIDRNCDMAIQKALEEMMNSREFLTEYLALFLDNRIRNRRAGDDTDFERTCTKALQMFKQFRNKDMFERYYIIHMARRLLGSKGVSEETERIFITKLKQDFGFAFTSKMEGMFQDQRSAPDVMEAFRRKVEQQRCQLPIDFHATVLTTGFWPITSSGSSLVFPPELNTCIDLFTRFYLSSHSGRKLTFHDSLGTAELRLIVGTKRYEVSVSTSQIVILMVFNTCDKISIGDLSKATGISSSDLFGLIQPLNHNTQSHSRLLLSSGTSLTETSELSFNSDFKSKHVKLKFCGAVQQEKEEERQVTRAKCNEDRKWIIESVVVRVMKSRRTMEHRNLVCECIELLQSKFEPSPEEIKRRIESLIERDYLERVPESRTRYNYLA